MPPDQSAQIPTPPAAAAISPPVPTTIDDLTKELINQTEAKGFDGYCQVVYPFIQKCSATNLEPYTQDRPAINTVIVRHPMEEYFYTKMGTYAFSNLRAIRKEKKTIGPIALQTAKDLFAMCAEMAAIGRRQSIEFEKALNKPAWGPTANIPQ